MNHDNGVHVVNSRQHYQKNQRAHRYPKVLKIKMYPIV